MSIARHASLQLSALLRLLLARIGSPRESSPAEDGVEPRRVVQPGPWASHLPLGTARLRIAGRRDASRADAARSGGDAGHMACAEDGAPGGADAALATSAVVFAFTESGQFLGQPHGRIQQKTASRFHSGRAAAARPSSLDSQSRSSRRGACIHYRRTRAVVSMPPPPASSGTTSANVAS